MKEDEMIEKGVWPRNHSQTGRYDGIIYEIESLIDLQERDEIKVVDIGCGTGEGVASGIRSLEDLAAPLGAEIESEPVGVDFFPGRLADASGRGVAPVQGYAQQLPFRDESFDIVVAANFLCYLEEEEELEGFLEAARITSTDGVISATLNYPGEDEPIYDLKYSDREVFPRNYVMPGEKLSSADEPGEYRSVEHLLEREELLEHETGLI